MIGGKTSSTNHINNMYIYDPGNPNIATDDVWTTGLNLPGSAVENPAVVTYDDKLYVFGGSTAPFSGAVTNAAVYDPDTDPSPTITTPEWDELAPMITARGGATAQVLNGDIYVIGGMDGSGASVNTVEIYDPETNTWSVGPSLQTRRDNPGSAVINNKLYVFGGRIRNADGSLTNGTLNTMEIFDPLTGQWTTGASMPTGRRTFAASTMNDRILVVGGETGPNNSTFTQLEEYNPSTNTWRSLPSAPIGKHGSAFGVIDEVFYVAGGGSSAGASFTDTIHAFTM
jgi:N-acetylneuraminic acid mutarotase